MARGPIHDGGTERRGRRGERGLMGFSPGASGSAGLAILKNVWMYRQDSFIAAVQILRIYLGKTLVNVSPPPGVYARALGTRLLSQREEEASPAREETKREKSAHGSRGASQGESSGLGGM